MGRKPDSQRKLARVESSRVVYEIKVRLRGIRPPIWRRVRVTSDTLLWGFHAILQVVMGWEDEHPHRFFMKGTYYGEPGLSPSGLEIIDEESVRLSDIVTDEGDKFVYQYGSGIGWNHEILIEKILAPKRWHRYPFCLDGKRACPPEHFLGPWEYREFLRALKEPSRLGDKERKGWVAADFHPEKFDQESVHRRLGWS
jgi:Plasmid pRiA4b ORF-3-like protein